MDQSREAHRSAWPLHSPVGGANRADLAGIVRHKAPACLCLERAAYGQQPPVVRAGKTSGNR
jgi:hypothetical protein